MLYLKNSRGLDGKQLVTDLFEWDVVNWSCCLDLWLPALRANKNAGGSRAIELGSRRGGLALLAAVEGYSVMCTDLTEPGDEAKSLHEKYGVASEVHYAALDITTDKLTDTYHGCYDVVLFKSVLGGAGSNGRNDLQAQAIANMYKMLKPGGVLLFAENLSGSALHRFFRTRFTTWGSYWNYPKRNDLEAMLEQSGFTCTTQAIGFLGAFGRSERQRHFLGKLDRYFLNYLLPSSWKYVLFGVCRRGENEGGSVN